MSKEETRVGLLESFFKLGVLDYFDVNVKKEHATTCPFCGKEKHLYYNTKKHLYDCKVCGEAGSIYTLFNYYQRKFKETLNDRSRYEKRLKPLIEWRKYDDDGIISGSDLGYNLSDEKYTCPTYLIDKDNRVIPCGFRYAKLGEHFFNPSGLPVGLINGRDLMNIKPGVKNKLFICEGEWDTFVMKNAVLNSDYSHNAIVVGITGATSTKALEQSIHHPGLFDIYTFLDNDEAGVKGTSRINKIFSNQKIKNLKWKEGLPKGYDVSDAFRDGATIESLLNDCEEYIDTRPDLPLEVRAKNKRGVVQYTDKIDDDNTEAKSIPPQIEYEEFERGFGETMRLTPSLKQTLRIFLAAYYGQRLHIERDGFNNKPLWLIIVSSSSMGKTELLQSFPKNDDIFDISSVSASALISGINKNPDPSVLAQMNGRITFMKDLTTVMIKKEEADTFFGLMREIYDGNVVRYFGNSVVRRYDDLKLGITAVATSSILPYFDTVNTSGYRFAIYNSHLDENNEIEGLEQDKVYSQYFAQKKPAQNRAIRADLYKKIMSKPLIEFDELEWDSKSYALWNLLVKYAIIISRINTPAVRDSMGRVCVPMESNGCMRLVEQMSAMLLGACCMYGDNYVSRRVYDVAKDFLYGCISKVKRKVLERIIYNNRTNHVGKEFDLEHVTRAVEELKYLHVIEQSETAVELTYNLNPLWADSILHLFNPFYPSDEPELTPPDHVKHRKDYNAQEGSVKPHIDTISNPGIVSTPSTNNKPKILIKRRMPPGIIKADVKDGIKIRRLKRKPPANKNVLNIIPPNNDGNVLNITSCDEAGVEMPIPLEEVPPAVKRIAELWQKENPSPPPKLSFKEQRREPPKEPLPPKQVPIPVKKETTPDLFIKPKKLMIKRRKMSKKYEPIFPDEETRMTTNWGEFGSDWSIRDYL